MKRGNGVFWLGLTLVLGVFIILGVKGIGTVEKRTESGVEQAVTATVGPVRDIIIAKGTVAYNRQVVLRSHINGHVTALTVKEGDEIVRGQQLIRISNPQEEIDLDLRKIEQHRGQENLSALNKNLVAMQRLVAIGGMSQFELDQKILERDAAEKEVEQARLELARLRQTVALSNLVSPVKGLVLSVSVESGQRVNAGDELISLSGGSGPYVVTYVDAMDVERINIGQAAIFSDQEDSGKRRKGRVKEIGRAVAGAQRPNAVKVIIESLEPIQDLRISQQLYVELVILEEDSVARIPRELIYRENGHQVVYVLTEQGIVAKPVHIQPGDLSFAKLISGVALTDRLVRKPQHVGSGS